MKIIKFLLSNFQVLNFFIASLIVGICIGLWYNPQSSQSLSRVQSDSLDQEQKTSTVNKVNTALKQSIPLNSSVEVSPISPQEENSNQKNLPTSPTLNTNISESPKLPPLPSEYSSSINPPVMTLPSQTVSIPQSQTYLGHFSYQETPQNRLRNMGKYYHRTEYLDQEAADAFLNMKAGAKAQGVDLVLISGFRTIAAQEKLFNKQIQKRGSQEAASKLSAPPGHSEHHTGYAMDIGDGTQPQKDLKFQFESTEAYNWLTNNAYQYGFELSFPRNNRQGVSFEPWHWRYVGSTRANQIFGMGKK